MISNIGFWTWLHIILSIISIGSIAVGTLFLLRVLVAKTNTKGLDDKGISGDSLVFFSSIS